MTTVNERIVRTFRLLGLDGLSRLETSDDAVRFLKPNEGILNSSPIIPGTKFRSRDVEPLLEQASALLDRALAEINQCSSRRGKSGRHLPSMLFGPPGL